MSSRENKVDEFGFPIPQTFENGQSQEQSVWSTSRPLRIALGVVTAIAVVAILFGPQIKDYSRRAMASRLSERAQEKYEADNIEGALADIEAASQWLPDEPALIRARGFFRLQAGDLEGSLTDYDRVVSMSPSFSPAYSERSVVYQRLGRHREAIDDTTKAIGLRPDRDHSALNHRAYTRAIAGMELTEGLADIDLALKLAGLEIPAYLDTRGYLLHLLGRDEEALGDMNKALRMTEREQSLQVAQTDDSGGPSQAIRLKRIGYDLAVMYQHRGLIHEKLGNKDQAKEDLALAKKLGYDPAKGVY